MALKDSNERERQCLKHLAAAATAHGGSGLALIPAGILL